MGETRVNIIVIDDDGSKRVYPSETLYDATLKNRIVRVASKSKEEHLLAIVRAYLSGAKPMIYDSENASLDQTLQTLDLSLFGPYAFAAMFFTSGSTGFPTGAFKTAHNLQTDTAALRTIFESYAIERVVATVPFIHIYGFLTGVMLPLSQNIDLVFKEHFLPHDLLHFAAPKSLIVTTPLYIKSLLRLDESADLSQSVFISSTGPLETHIAQAFIEKFNTTLVQLFGSTESGSIAYKKQTQTLWTPFESVEVSLNDEGLLCLRSPFISPTLWNEKGFSQTQGILQTFDFARIDEGKFQLLGRQSNIIKIAGKRYSTQHIEEILEAQEGIFKAFVHVQYDAAKLKDESILIFVETSKPLTSKAVQTVLKRHFGKINIPMSLHVVDHIPITAMGKKRMPIQFTN
jgi:acyl-coenzyme A synthetase/AMP-(fatty) acid ligase